jgi:PTS system ascorbate-specific IIA component
MIGILLITHDTLGESLLQCASHVLNKRPDQILQLGMAAGDDPNDLLPLAKKLLKLIDTGEGVLVITDIYGASPSNLVAKLLQPGKIEGVAGANLPLLLRAINNREKGMDNLLTKTTTGGRDGVLNMLKH